MDVATIARTVGPRGQFCVITRLRLVARGNGASVEVSQFALTLVDLVEGRPRLDQLRQHLLALFMADPTLTPQRLAAVLRPRQASCDCGPIWQALGDLVVSIGALALTDALTFRAELGALTS